MKFSASVQLKKSVLKNNKIINDEGFVQQTETLNWMKRIVTTVLTKLKRSELNSNEKNDSGISNFFQNFLARFYAKNDGEKIDYKSYYLTLENVKYKVIFNYLSFEFQLTLDNNSKSFKDKLFGKWTCIYALRHGIENRYCVWYGSCTSL